MALERTKTWSWAPKPRMTVLLKGSSNILLCSGQSQFRAHSMPLAKNMEADKSPLLEAAIKQRLVKTKQTEKT
jgi:hypothetical protein